VAVESTGTYWVPIHTVLEGSVGLIVGNAYKIKHTPGNKNDLADADWIAELCLNGMIEPSRIFPKADRNLRRLTRIFVKRLTIRRSATKKWYVSFLVEKSINHVLEPSEKVVGVDMGIKNFAVLSNGEFIENPRFLLADEEHLIEALSKRDKLPKGSLQRKKATKTVGHLYERVANRRENFAQQVSREYIIFPYFPSEVLFLIARLRSR
jgi:transposase